MHVSVALSIFQLDYAYQFYELFHEEEYCQIILPCPWIFSILSRLTDVASAGRTSFYKSSYNKTVFGVENPILGVVDLGTFD